MAAGTGKAPAMDIQLAETILETSRAISRLRARVGDGRLEPLSPEDTSVSHFLYRRIHEILGILDAGGGERNALPTELKDALAEMDAFLDWYLDQHL